MRLIDEIEAAAKSSPRGPGTKPTKEQVDAYLTVTDSAWWPRIRAALLAGEALMQCSAHDGLHAGCDECDAVDRFRAATEGTDAAAIGRAS